jgi:adenine-specific DNA-methyltransferase
MTLSSDSLTQNKKDFAQFYTPQKVAQALIDWAITDSDTTVLDPSFGGCAFLYAALETLSGMGSPAPARQICGVDIDPDAQSYLGPLLLADATPEQFVTANFFDIAPDHFGDKLFGAVVGNPPYIRYHDIPHEAQEQAIVRLESFNIHISKRASYWAFFLLYSMQFLRQGGRLAMVLPGAFLHADYSTQVRELLIQHFEEVTIYLLQERIFDGTDEESVLVCAAGAQRPHRELRIGAIAKAEDIEHAFERVQSSTRAVDDAQKDGGWLRALIEPETLALYDKLVENSSVIRMGEWVKTRIGVVTGNNGFFILSREEQEQRDIPSGYLVPIIKRSVHLTGLWVRDENLQILAENGNKFLLLALNRVESRLPKPLREYIQYGWEVGVSKAQKCRERQPWYVVPHTFVPPAFMPCMSAAWPRLIVNQSSYTCTNNILRLLWQEERPTEDWFRLALGTLSTLSQLSAELVGRSYGGGVLKLEPKELARLAVPLVSVEAIDELAPEVDSLLRQDKLSEATDAVNSALLSSNIGLTTAELERLRVARNRLFLRRRQHRRDAQGILRVGS